MSQKYLPPKKLTREEYVKLPLEERLITLSKAEDERAKELQQKLLKIDIHSHGVVQFPYTVLPTLPLSQPIMEGMPTFLDGRIPSPIPRELATYMKDLRNHPLEAYVKYYKIHWEGWKQAGVTGVHLILGGTTEDYERCIVSLGFAFADVDMNPMGKRAYCAEDIRNAKKEGKIAFLAATEANPFGNVIERVEILYGLGFRQVGMTYELSNYSGAGGTDEKPGMSLTPFGHQVVGELNRFGIIIDLSHVGRNTAMDTIKASSDPVALSHNGARGVYSGSRCRDDEMLKAMADKGGIIGISGVPNVLSNNSRQGVKNWFDHADYCVKLIGVDHVGVGLDSNWSDHVGSHKISPLPNMKNFPTDYVEGLENPTETWRNIIRVLVAEGYSDKEIEKITGANALRLIERVVG